MFLVGPTAELDITGDVNFFGTGTASVLVQGRLVKSAGTGIANINIATTVVGEIEAAAGFVAMESVAAVTHGFHGQWPTSTTATVEPGGHVTLFPCSRRNHARFSKRRREYGTQARRQAPHSCAGQEGRDSVFP